MSRVMACSAVMTVTLFALSKGVSEGSSVVYRGVEVPQTSTVVAPSAGVGWTTPGAVQFLQRSHSTDRTRPC